MKLQAERQRKLISGVSRTSLAASLLTSNTDDSELDSTTRCDDAALRDRWSLARRWSRCCADVRSPLSRADRLPPQDAGDPTIEPDAGSRDANRPAAGARRARLPIAAGLAVVLALRPRRKGTPHRQARRHPDPDHPGHRRRRRDAGRRRQPGPRLRHRRRRRAGALSRQDRRSEGRRRHAVDAGGRPRGRRRPVDAGGVRHGVRPGRAVDHRVVRAEDARGRSRWRSRRRIRPTFKPKLEELLDAHEARARAAERVGGRDLLRGAGAARPEDRSAVGARFSSWIRRTRRRWSGRRRKKKK